jgi:predicted nuclease of predicted toxin-antitoxin system
MNFLADEGVDKQIVERLRIEGYSVLYVAEMQPGINDDLVLDLANQHSALLITADKDFGELVFRLRRLTSGVILLRLAGLSPERKAQIVAVIVNQYPDKLNGAFTVIAPGSLRIRQQPN